MSQKWFINIYLGEFLCVLIIATNLEYGQTASDNSTKLEVSKSYNKTGQFPNRTTDDLSSTTNRFYKTVLFNNNNSDNLNDNSNHNSDDDTLLLLSENTPHSKQHHKIVTNPHRDVDILTDLNQSINSALDQPPPNEIKKAMILPPPSNLNVAHNVTTTERPKLKTQTHMNFIKDLTANQVFRNSSNNAKSNNNNSIDLKNVIFHKNTATATDIGSATKESPLTTSHLRNSNNSTNEIKKINSPLANLERIEPNVITVTKLEDSTIPTTENSDTSTIMTSTDDNLYEITPTTITSTPEITTDMELTTVAPLNNTSTDTTLNTSSISDLETVIPAEVTISAVTDDQLLNTWSDLNNNSDLDHEPPDNDNFDKSRTSSVVVEKPKVPATKNLTGNRTRMDVLTLTDNNNSNTEVTMPDEIDLNTHHEGMIAAIIIASVGGICLTLLVVLLLIIRKRQTNFTYAQRCTPVSLDQYGIDSIHSVQNSFRRKDTSRQSKNSFGNPGFDDPGCVSNELTFSGLRNFYANRIEVHQEFASIPHVTTRASELPDGCHVKNRYANIIPLPETRVVLTPIEGYPNSDYINANYVNGHLNVNKYYIACQAPMENTVDDFWRMIWEQQTQLVLMLTQHYENKVEKCYDYLPRSEVLDTQRSFGNFQVILKKRDVKEKYIISGLQLKDLVSNSSRNITHIWYLGWPETGVPADANHLIAFLLEARIYMKAHHTSDPNSNPTVVSSAIVPVVVHCSPGTGRTGVVIACDIAIREFEQSRRVNIPRIVYKIRRCRANAVQTKEQYSFIYKVIYLYASKLTEGVLDFIR